MNRFFFNKKSLVHGEVHIEGEDVSHITRVLRLGEGDRVLLCDGEGQDYLGEITGLDKNLVKLKVLEKSPSKAEPLREFTLFQGIPKGDKMDLIIQKCVEMGIHKIVPVAMARSVPKIGTDKDGAKKVERWQRIALEAAKQSGRGRIPEVTMPISFKKVTEVAKDMELKLIPYEKEDGRSLKRVLTEFREKDEHRGFGVGILIGPEGGIDEGELNLAIQAGFSPVTLGKRILRTETAGFVALACAMYELNEME